MPCCQNCKNREKKSRPHCLKYYDIELFLFQTIMDMCMHQVVALEVALERRVEAVHLAALMPKHWQKFIREGPSDEIKDLGVIRRVT